MQNEKKTLIISDLHEHVTSLGWQAIYFLSSILPYIDNLYLNGDIAECHSSYPCLYGEEGFKKFIATWSHVLLHITGQKESKYLPQTLMPKTQVNTHYLPGNHDAEGFIKDTPIPFANQITQELICETEGATYFVEHGHRIVKVGKYMLNKGDVPAKMDDYSMHLETNRLKQEAFAHTFGTEAFLYFNNKAKLNWGKRHEELSNQGVEDPVLIMGHTHCQEAGQEEAFAKRKPVVLNTGPGCYRAIEFGVMGQVTGDLAFYKVKREIFNKGPKKITDVLNPRTIQTIWSPRMIKSQDNN